MPTRNPGSKCFGLLINKGCDLQASNFFQLNPIAAIRVTKINWGSNRRQAQTLASLLLPDAHNSASLICNYWEFGVKG